MGNLLPLLPIQNSAQYLLPPHIPYVGGLWALDCWRKFLYRNQIVLVTNTGRGDDAKSREVATNPNHNIKVEPTQVPQLCREGECKALWYSSV